MDEDTPLFSVGLVTGGPEASPIRDGLMRFMRRTRAARANWPSASPRINIVFQMSGSLISLDIEGVRATRLRKSDLAILVSAVVPRDLRADGLDAYLRGVLMAAKDEASRLLVKRHFSGDLGEVGRLIDVLARDPLGSQS